ncbi:MAG: hypothetical protein ACHRXM_25500, partial [Isosphaerales bacterium]
PMPENPSSTPPDPEPSPPAGRGRLFLGPPIQSRRKDVVGRDNDLAVLKGVFIRETPKGKSPAYCWSRPDEIDRLWRQSGKTLEELAD